MCQSVRAPHAPRVLVVEDDAALRTLIADVLRVDGYSVTEVASAQEMQDAVLQGEQPDNPEPAFELVVTDVWMPGKSGLDGVAELRSRGVTSRFIVITAFPEGVTERRIRELDAHLLAKPFPLTGLRALVRALLASEPALVPA